MSFTPSTRSDETDHAILYRGMPIPTLVIQPSPGWSALRLHDLWEYRELAYFFVVREIQGIYRQTALGMTWLFIRPTINMLLLSLVFGRLVQVPSDGLPYPLFSLAALIPWGYFSNSVLRASRSLIDNRQIISKVYFPRMVLPLAGAISGLVDLMASFLVFFVAMLVYRVPFRMEMLWLPIFILVTMAFALAVGLWLATLAVVYQDVSFAINFLIQGLMYLSPVIYSISLVPSSLTFVYQLNPMTGVISGFRWALLGSGEAPSAMFLLSVGVTIALLFSGAYIFRRTEKNIVDVL
jgi:lipopolysaccharide transport system permease protein